MSITLEEIKNKLAKAFAVENGEIDKPPITMNKHDLLETDEHAFMHGFDACLFLMKNYECIDPIGWVNKSTMEWVSEETVIADINKNTKP